jgi:hypothetical protein
MIGRSACSALLLVAVGFLAPSPLDTCWRGSTTNGSNPGLNTMTLCIADDGAAGLRVYFPNTPLQEPPTNCSASGLRTEAQGNTFRIVTDVGRCDNGGIMGQYDLRCTVAVEDTLLCTFPVASGNLIDLRLEKIAP